MSYFLERSTNLAWPFAVVATNIIGQAGASTYTDTNATDARPSFSTAVEC